jgi:hypothetical protein
MHVSSIRSTSYNEALASWMHVKINIASADGAVHRLHCLFRTARKQSLSDFRMSHVASLNWRVLPAPELTHTSPDDLESLVSTSSLPTAGLAILDHTSSLTGERIHF